MFLLLLSLPVAAGPSSSKRKAGPEYDLQTGDILFQATGGQQCQAIRAATHSPFSHCGVVFQTEDGHFRVLEAVSPVASTPLDQFKRRSVAGTFHARRLKTAGKALTPEVFRKAATSISRGGTLSGRTIWSSTWKIAGG